MLAAILFTVGSTLVASSMWKLGVTGTYLGDYFGILMTVSVRMRLGHIQWQVGSQGCRGRSPSVLSRSLRTAWLPCTVPSANADFPASDLTRRSVALPAWPNLWRHPPRIISTISHPRTGSLRSPSMSATTRCTTALRSASWPRHCGESSVPNPWDFRFSAALLCSVRQCGGA